MIKTTLHKLFLATAGLALLSGIVATSFQPASAAVNRNNLISDAIFENNTSMSAAQINSLLNSYSASCISPNNNFTTADPQGFSNGAYRFGGATNAGQAIYDIAQNYHVSPRVILATMQKEQSIPTGAHGCHADRPNPADPSQIYSCAIGGQTTNCTDACPYSYAGGCMNIAMSYGCPGSCKAAIEGFSNQLSAGSWLLRFSQERAYGILTGYAGHDSGDENYSYSGPMTAGYRQRVAGGSSIYYDGSWTAQDGVSVNVANGGTASLYTYTPFANDSNFSRIFTEWFGDPTYVDPNANILSFVHLNDTSGNVQVVGYPSYNNYSQTVRTDLSGYPAVATNGSIVPLTKPNGDLSFVNLNYNGPGGPAAQVVSYSASSGFKQLTENTVTNYPATTDYGAVIPRYQPNGDLSFIRLNHASGQIEVVTYSASSGFKRLSGYALSGYPAITPDGSVIPMYEPTGDLSFVRMNHASGQVEVVSYTSGSNFRQMSRYSLTGYPAVGGSGAVIPRYQPNGDLSFVRLNHSSGKVEVVTYGAGSNYKQLTGYSLTGYPAVTPDGSVIPLFSR